MAIVYPSASGNWSDTSLWMEVGGNPYNQIPQEGDVVYLNGCTMNMNIDINLGTNGEIRNDGDDGQGISVGGYLYNPFRGVIITANIKSYGDGIVSAGNNTSGYNMTFNGNIDSYGGNFWLSTNTGTITSLYWTVVGNINNYGNTANTFFRTRSTGNTTINITGNIYSEGVLILSNCQRNLSVTGDITGNVKYSVDYLNSVVINGDVDLGSDTFINSYIASLTINGNFSKTTGNFISSYITTFNMNGTLTQGTGQIASYITTLNLDGTLNLSGTRPFTYGVQNLNVATGGQVTYDNHLYYCFTNIVAVDSNFTITCRNQNLDNFDFKNKNLLNNTYPIQANVSDGYVYGLEDQFTGSYQLPPESVVLEGTPYGSYVGTLTLDISSSVQDTIDDIEDEVNILVDSYPPLVTLESITNIGNTSATINLSVSNTALITKTGAEVDIDWNFSNPYEYEVNNWATSVNVTGLNPSVQYYVRGYVIYDGNKVYSSANTLQTLLLPPELQLCEYLQTDGNCYINIRPNEFPINNYNARIKYKTIDGTEQGIWGCRTTSTTGMLHSQFTATTNSLRLGYANSNNDNTNSAYQQAIQYWNKNNIKVTRWDGTQIRAITPTLSNVVVKNVCLFGIYNNETNTVFYMKSGGVICEFDFTTFDQISRLVSAYIKTGETYTDNKGNSCSAGTCGFFDVLTQTFYTNDGGGNFTHGNDII